MPVPAATAAKLGWDQVAAWRAARHRLEERASATAMLEVVAGITGLHAQVMSSAELTLWARVEGLAPDAVRRALWEERSLVKTWAMRATLHLLPAAEFPVWQAALSTRRLWEAGAWQRGFGVSLAELERLNAAIAQALDGQLLTREELAVRVGELTGSGSWATSSAGAGGRCSSRPPPSAWSASPPTRGRRSASPAPTPGSAAGRATTPTRPWMR
jgi:Winged helix DNA-binding domain